MKYGHEIWHLTSRFNIYDVKLKYFDGNTNKDQKKVKSTINNGTNKIEV